MKVEVKPFSRQAIALGLLFDSKTLYLLYGGAAGGGKSILGCLWLILSCYRFQGSRWFLARETLSNLKKSTIVTFWKALDLLGLPRDAWKQHAHDNYIELKSNGSRIDYFEVCFYPRDPDYERFGSREYTGGWIEEAQETDERAFDTLKSRVGRHNNAAYGIPGKILLTCNPKKNWLYTQFYSRRSNLPEGWAFVPSLAADNPFLDPQYRRNLDEISDLAKRQRLRDGSWDYEDDPEQLISFEWIVGALRVPACDGVVSIGVDVAGDSGRSETSVVSRVRGNIIDPLEYYHGLDAEQVAERVKLAANMSRWPCQSSRIRVDTVGIGAGTWFCLRNMGITARKFLGGIDPIKRPKEPYQFKNLRSQAWWELREKLRLGQLHLPEMDNRLAEDLCSIYYRTISEKMIQIEDKMITRRRVGKSPDGGDALMMAAFDWPNLTGATKGRHDHRPIGHDNI